MKLALPWFCILHLALVSASLIFGRRDHEAVHNSLANSRAQAPQGPGDCDFTAICAAGPSNPGRHRPLFARRRQYERQRIHKPKDKEVSVPPNDLSPPWKVAPKPPQSSCSQLTQSCLPHAGCCDQNASCHCRFFNAICFCRRTNLKKKT